MKNLDTISFELPFILHANSKKRWKYCFFSAGCLMQNHTVAGEASDCICERNEPFFPIPIEPTCYPVLRLTLPKSDNVCAAEAASHQE